jgi:hypothetical protein
VLNESPCQEDVWRNGGVASPFLTSAPDRGERSASRPGRYTIRGKRPWWPWNGRLGGPQGRSGRCVEREILLPLPGVEPWPPNPSPVPIQTEISRLHIMVINSVMHINLNSLLASCNIQICLAVLFSAQNEVTESITPVITIMLSVVQHIVAFQRVLLCMRFLSARST